ncbi:MAG: hypothetical protein IPF72_19395 [Chitinophagaceae bacterium]|nr:hypothetical protein [Chitinophagaceae bacterium]
MDMLLSGDGPKLEPLLRWLLEASPVATMDGEPRRTSRLRRLQEALTERDLAATLAEEWNHASAIRLLAETGLPDRTSLLGEGFLRLVDRIIPRLDAEGDLYALLDRLGLAEADAAWIEGLPVDLRTAWGRLVKPPVDIWVHAAQLLAHRAAAVGLSRDLLSLDPAGSDADSPFFTLSHAVRVRGERPQDPEARLAWEQCRAECARALDQAQDRIEEKGVSSDLVFRLELLQAQLERIAQLLLFASGDGDGTAFAAELVRGSASQHGFVTLVRTTVKRLARKVVEHTGETGEHYIARDRREWRAMGWSAAGGGVLTAGTALFKYGLSALPLAPLLMGLSLALNYAGSFFLMQLLGFSLASKQPAMTAAALARALEGRCGPDSRNRPRRRHHAHPGHRHPGQCLRRHPRRPGHFGAVDRPEWSRPVRPGHRPAQPPWQPPLLGLDPGLRAATGVLLWLSSLAAGWAANWSAYRRLPEALAQSRRIRALLGADRAQGLGRFVHRHISGFVGYAALGGLLVFVPMAFAFAGIHLEVRHVTLQAAALALASASLWVQGLPALGGGPLGPAGRPPHRRLEFRGVLRPGPLDRTARRGFSGRASRRLWWGLSRPSTANQVDSSSPPKTSDTLDSRPPGGPHA